MQEEDAEEVMKSGEIQAVEELADERNSRSFHSAAAYTREKHKEKRVPKGKSLNENLPPVPVRVHHIVKFRTKDGEFYNVTTPTCKINFKKMAFAPSEPLILPWFT